MLILRDQAMAWPVTALGDLDLAHLDAVLSAGPAEVEFLLLGVGAVNAQPPRVVRDALAHAGIGLEFMDTPTAARTYNLLTSEGRRLAAALIAV